MPDTPLFTLSRDDVYDYLRCPKIVSINAFRALTVPKEKKKESQGTSMTRTIGAIGEVAAAVVFSPPAVVLGRGRGKERLQYGTRLQQAQMRLSEIGIWLDGEMKELLQRTVEGLTVVKRFLSEEYGELAIIGRGESRNGPMPGQALPDFVAISPKQGQPILIEVKNVARISALRDHFQAAYYNTVAKEVGVVVLEERVESGLLALTPKSFYEAVTETIVVYPRLERYEKISYTIDLSEETVEEVWRAKQLGFIGKSPHTDCDASCPHHRLGIELPEENLEVAAPLPLVFAEGLVEQDADLDSKYYRNFLWRTGLGPALFETMLRRGVTEKYNQMDKRKEVAKIVNEKTGIPMEMIEKMLVFKPRLTEAEVLPKIMANEIEPWQRILGKGRLEGSVNNIRGLTTKLYTLPYKSTDFVRRSWRRWRGS